MFNHLNAVAIQLKESFENVRWVHKYNVDEIKLTAGERNVLFSFDHAVYEEHDEQGDTYRVGVFFNIVIFRPFLDNEGSYENALADLQNVKIAVVNFEPIEYDGIEFVSDVGPKSIDHEGNNFMKSEVQFRFFMAESFYVEPQPVIATVAPVTTRRFSSRFSTRFS